jgi:hypothetical protein
MTIDERLERIESMLFALIERQTIKDYYDIDEFARVVGRASFTCREMGKARPDQRGETTVRQGRALLMGDQSQRAATFSTRRSTAGSG